MTTVTTTGPPIAAPPAGVLSAFRDQTTVVGEDGNLYAVGYNAQGQFGTGNTVQTTIFKLVLSGVQTADGNHHTMALKKDGSVWAAGSNSRGELGDGSTTSRKTFVKVIEKDVVHIHAGHFHTMALKIDGSLWGTGLNQYGQLGDGTTTNRNKFVKVIDAGGAKDVYTGDMTTFVVKKDGSLWGTGLNQYGQLGDGTTTNRPGQLIGVISRLSSTLCSLSTQGMILPTSTLCCSTYGTVFPGGRD